MRFAQAFDLSPGDVVSFIGAGGKTSLLVSLGYELAEAGWRVLATTTTRIESDQLSLFPCAMPADSSPRAISLALNEKQFVLLHDELSGGRVYGPGPDWAGRALDSVDSDILLVEADNAEGMPFKAPAVGEPRIPPETTLVVAVASLRALGKPLNAEHVYNPEPMMAKYGFVENSPVKSPWLAQVLRDEDLGLKGVPTGARVMIFLNHTPEHGYVRGRARLIARLCLQSQRVSAVALGSVRGAEAVFEMQRSLGALVLAAGDASNPDLAPLLHRSNGAACPLAAVAEQLMRSRIDHIRLVTGKDTRQVKRAVKHLGIKNARNRNWKSGGLVSSLKTGLEALPPHVSAALLVPASETRMQNRLVYQIMSAYARCQGDFIAPRFQYRPARRDWTAGPVLIARKYWIDLLNMPRHCSLDAIIKRFEADVSFLDIAEDGSLLHNPAVKPIGSRFPASVDGSA